MPKESTAILYMEVDERLFLRHYRSPNQLIRTHIS